MYQCTRSGITFHGLEFRALGSGIRMQALGLLDCFLAEGPELQISFEGIPVH